MSRAGFPVAVCELADPLTVRRAVALSSAVTRGEVTVEGLTARRVNDVGEVSDLAATGVVPVLVDHGLPRVSQSVVVDARMAKRPLDTRPDDAPFVVALGSGFSAGKDCHAVVVTRDTNLDVTNLPHLLATVVGTVGVMGSTRRWAGTRAALEESGVTSEDLDRVTSPIGMDLGAETPEEIAVSIMAQILEADRGADA